MAVIYARRCSPIPDIDDLIYGDTGTVPSERAVAP